MMADKPEVYMREATAKDTDFAVACQEALLKDMVSYGGHALNDGALIRERLQADLRDSLGKGEYVVLLAGLLEEDDHPIGMVEANLMRPYDIFEPKLVLHIRSVFVESGRR